MKFFRICPGLVGKRLYKFQKEQSLFNKTFSEIIQSYRSDNILLPGSWAEEIEKRGHEVFEIVYPDLVSQLKWVYENQKFNFTSKSYADQFLQILLDQITHFNPDVVFIYAGAVNYFPPNYIKKIKNRTKRGTRFIAYWGDEFINNISLKDFFKSYDLVLTSTDTYTKMFKNAGFSNTKTLGNCFEPKIKFNQKLNKKYKFTFSGVSGYGYIDHIQRYEKLLKILERSDLRVWTSEPRNYFKIKKLIISAMETLPISLTNLIFKTITRLIRPNDITKDRLLSAQRIIKLNRVSGYDFLIPSYFDLKKSVKKKFPNRVKKSFTKTKDYYELILQSDFCLNLHRDEGADYGNIRDFEITGLGSCMVTDRQKELKEFFDPEREIVGFNNIEEMLEKIKYLDKHKDIAKQISDNGKKKTLNNYTTMHKVELFLELLEADNKNIINNLSNKREKIIQTDRELNLKYDLTKNPISFDFYFFLQAAAIIKLKYDYTNIRLYIKVPSWFKNRNMNNYIKNLTKSENTFEGGHNFETITEKIETIILPSFKYFPIDKVEYVEDFDSDIEYYYEGEFTHHAQYYQELNNNPELKYNISSSISNKKTIDSVIKELNKKNKKVITITIRNYFDQLSRNSNLEEWKKTINKLKDKYFIVLVPDTFEYTGHHSGNKSYEMLYYDYLFNPVLSNFDYRLALYETSYLNLFVNNGPCVVSSLSENVNFIMFKFETREESPHTDPKFLKMLGYSVGLNPKYLNEKKQKYIWDEDDSDLVMREIEIFNKDFKLN